MREFARLEELAVLLGSAGYGIMLRVSVTAQARESVNKWTRALNSVPPLARAWIVALLVAGLYLLVGSFLSLGTGLIRTVAIRGQAPTPADARHVERIGLDGIATAARDRADVSVMWRGVWDVRASGMYDLALASGGSSAWTIDGHAAIIAQPTPTADPARASRTVWLAAGYHPIEITCSLDAGLRLVVAAAKAGHEPQPLAARTLLPAIPTRPWLRNAGHVLHRLLGWLALAAALWAARRTIATRRSRAAMKAPAHVGRTVAWLVLACIVLHGALLRLDAITGRYGPVSSPRWLAAAQTRTFLPPDAIRSLWMVWEPEPLYPHPAGPPTHYRSDPYIYLDAARKMPSFYAAHFREPLFPFATRVFLSLLDDQDVAVSFASAFFSVAAIWFTYILGAAVWSRPVGLLAALGLSLDYDVIAHGTLGWRDDAYVAAVVLCAYLMVRCWRVARQPARMRRVGRRLEIDQAHLEAAALGIAAGLAILTRIMAVSFLAAGGLFLLLAVHGPSQAGRLRLPLPSRRRLAMAAVALAAAAIVAGPYFVNCWRVYGDPLYTFNVHGGIYSQAEGKEKWTQSTAAYVGEKFRSQPIEMLDTIAQGLTTYPFQNKWRGLDRWYPQLGDWASIAALIGLVVLAASSPGRLLLLVGVASLVPCAFTWKVDPDFRFTEHVYPLLLIAAAVSLGAGARAVRSLLVPRVAGEHPGSWTVSWRAWAAVVAIGLFALWFVQRVSPSWAFVETLRAGEDATAAAGSRDGAFFGSGWSGVIHGGNVSARVVTADASLSIPLPRVCDYPVTLRMDPFPRPLIDAPQRLPVLEVTLNGAAAGVIPLHWSPDRVGSYDMVLPRALVREGVNEVRLRIHRPASQPPGAGVQPGLTDGDAVGLWYVRVHPGK